MAIDSRDKRGSALGKPWFRVYPVADGTIDAGDRLQAAGLYRGVAAAAPDDNVFVVGGNDSLTRLLIHFNGDDGSTSVFDRAVGGVTKTLAMVFGAQVSQVAEKFGNGSLFLPGGGDHLLVGASTDFNFGLGDFTVECWVQFRVLHDPYVWSWYLDENNYFSVSFVGSVGGSARFFVEYVRSGIDQLASGFSPSLNARDITDGFHHFAFVRSNSGKTFALYIDGLVAVAKTTAAAVSVDLSSWPLFIGKARLFGQPNLRHMDGYIDEFRVQREAVWTAEFTPFSNEYTPVFSMSGDGKARLYAATSNSGRGKYGLAKRLYDMSGRGTAVLRAAISMAGRGTAALRAATLLGGRGRYGLARREYEKAASGKAVLRAATSTSGRGQSRILTITYSMSGRGTARLDREWAMSGRGISRWLTRYTMRGRGAHRIADTTIALYELYHAVDAQPDLTGAADATSATLPFTFAISGAGVHNIVVRRRNQWNLVSQNVIATSIELDGANGEIITVPTAPEKTTMSAAGANTVLVESQYPYEVDASPGDQWYVYITSNGVDPNPAVDSPTVVAIEKFDRLAKLAWTSPAFNQDDDVRAIVRINRSSDGRESTNTNVVNATANAIGPVAGSGGALQGGSDGGASV